MTIKEVANYYHQGLITPSEGSRLMGEVLRGERPLTSPERLQNMRQSIRLSGGRLKEDQ